MSHSSRSASEVDQAISREFSQSSTGMASCCRTTVMLIVCLMTVASLKAETAVQSERAHRIALLIWQSQFTAAIDSCQSLVRQESFNPLGYCLLGITFHSINSQYRTDRYADSVMWNLDTAIALADQRVKAEGKQKGLLFVLGSAYGYRALEQSAYGHWWAAFKDGHRSCSDLEAAYRLDTSLTEALLGIGDYHYWKSAKSKAVTWLPFVKDRRKDGIGEIRQVLHAESGAELNAAKSLMPIYLNEAQYARVIKLVDSLNLSGYCDPSCLLQKVKAEIGLESWDTAALTLEELYRAWENSPFFDSCGACEAEFLKAKILEAKGMTNAADSCLEDILAKKDSCTTNGYFRQTASDAQAMLH